MHLQPKISSKTHLGPSTVRTTRFPPNSLPSSSLARLPVDKVSHGPVGQEYGYPVCDCFPAGAKEESVWTVNSVRLNLLDALSGMDRKDPSFVDLRYWSRCLNRSLSFFRSLNNAWGANETAHDKSGRVRVDSQSSAPRIFWPSLIHDRCFGLLMSGGCAGFCSSLKLSASPVVVLALVGMCEAALLGGVSLVQK